MEVGSPIKILYRVENLNGNETRSFITEISCEELANFRGYKVHDHNHDDYSIQRGFDKLKNVYDLGTSDLPVMRLMVKVESFIYGHIFRGIIMRLNLDDLGGKWERIIQPFSPHRWNPKLISLRDKLYVFGGIPTTLDYEINYDLEPFGEVFDPKFSRWSTLVAPPQASLLNVGFDSLFIASLGETEGKIMVYSPIDKDSVIYIYDVDTRVWETRLCSALDSILVANRRISGSEVFNEYDSMVYWLDKRTAFIYAFNWKNHQLYSGPIIGLECEHGFKTKIHETDFVSLRHLSRDLFYLFWDTSNWEQQVDVKSELHFTVLQVVKHPSIRALDAFVVGCLKDTVSGSYCSFDAVHI